jgi:hypothetical protein
MKKNPQLYRKIHKRCVDVGVWGVAITTLAILSTFFDGYVRPKIVAMCAGGVLIIGAAVVVAVSSYFLVGEDPPERNGR